MHAYIKKEERLQINNLVLYLKEAPKMHTKPQASRKQAIIKTRMNINEIENRNTIESIKQKLVLWKNNTIDKHLVRLTIKIEVNQKIMKYKMKAEITTSLTDK